MGGVMIVVPVMLVTVLFNFGYLVGIDALGRSVFVPMGSMLMFAVLGAHR